VGYVVVMIVIVIVVMIVIVLIHFSFVRNFIEHLLKLVPHASTVAILEVVFVDLFLVFNEVEHVELVDVEERIVDFIAHSQTLTVLVEETVRVFAEFMFQFPAFEFCLLHAEGTFVFPLQLFELVEGEIDLLVQGEGRAHALFVQVCNQFEVLFKGVLPLQFLILV